jgi:hypothetical protein
MFYPYDFKLVCYFFFYNKWNANEKGINFSNNH